MSNVSNCKVNNKVASRSKFPMDSAKPTQFL